MRNDVTIPSLILLSVLLIIWAAPTYAQEPEAGYERTVRTLDGQAKSVDESTTVSTRGRGARRPAGQMTFGWEIYQLATLRFGLSFGYTLGKRGALYTMLAAGGWAENWNGPNFVQNGRTFNLRASYRLYFSGTPMQGFFVAPFFRQKIIRYDVFDSGTTDPWGQPIVAGNADRRTFVASAGGFNLGWQLMAGKFHYDTFIGLGLQTNTKDATAEADLYRPFDAINRGVMFQMGTSIGFGLPRKAKQAQE